MTNRDSELLEFTETTQDLPQKNTPELLPGRDGSESSDYIFNPEADYSWRATDSFELKGKELEILHNTLGSIFGSNLPLAQMYLMLNKCFEISSDIIKRNVEIGRIKQSEHINHNEA
jgi:hypothetical protein